MAAPYSRRELNSSSGQEDLSGEQKWRANVENEIIILLILIQMLGSQFRQALVFGLLRVSGGGFELEGAERQIWRLKLAPSLPQRPTKIHWDPPSPLDGRRVGGRGWRLPALPLAGKQVAYEQREEHGSGD